MNTRPSHIDLPRPRYSSLRPLLWFARFTPLLLGVFLLYIILFGWFGVDALGVPDLFWHEDPLKQFLAGFGVALVLSSFCINAYLLDADKDWMHEPPAEVSGRPHWSITGGLWWLLDHVVKVPRSLADSPRWRTLRWYFAHTWLPLLVIAIIPAVVVVERGERWRDVPGVFAREVPGGWWIAVVIGKRFWFILGILFAALFQRLLVVAYDLIRWRRVAGLFLRMPRLRGLPRDEQEFHLLVSWVVTFLIVLYFVLLGLLKTPLRPLVVSPALALCIVFGVFALIYGFIRFHFREFVAPIFLLLVLLGVAANGQSYRLRFPYLSYDHPVSLAEHDQNYTKTLAAYDKLPPSEKEKFRTQELEAWRKRFPDEKPKLVVVTVSGGAHRSALWTGVVLAQVETEILGFSRHVRLITGASGGMLGVAGYAATFTEKGCHEDYHAGRLANEQQRGQNVILRLVEDSLTPVAQQWVLIDSPLRFVPFVHRVNNRGLALERAWERQVESLNQPFVQLAEGEREGWRPSLILSPMLVEDGRRLLISNLRLPYLTQSHGSFLLPKEEGGSVEELVAAAVKSGDLARTPPPRKKMAVIGEDRYSLSALEFRELFPQAADFKLSTAVRMSATFPYITPAAELPTVPPRRVVDAGYYDNFGVNLAAEWIYHNRGWIRRNTSGVCLIQIRDFLTQERRRQLFDPEEDTAPWSLFRGLHGFTGPFAGLLQARESVMSFRNDEQLQALDDWFNEEGRRSRSWFSDGSRSQFFTTIVFECPQEIALSWYLPEADKRKILAGFQVPNEAGRPNVNQAALHMLKEWWARKD